MTLRFVNRDVFETVKQIWLNYIIGRVTRWGASLAYIFSDSRPSQYTLSSILEKIISEQL